MINLLSFKKPKIELRGGVNVSIYIVKRMSDLNLV